MFLTAQDFVNSVSVGESLTVSEKWEEVFTQAIRHTRGDGIIELMGKQRPHESEHVRLYRIENIRHITKEGAVKFNDKAARILQSSNYTVANESDELKEWIRSTSFQLGNGDTVGFNEYFTRFVLPCSFEDPNAIIVAFPYNKANPLIAPAAPVEDGGQPRNETVGVMPLVVPSADLWHVGPNIFSWHSGFMDVKIEGGGVQSHPWYYIVDRFNFYQYIPTGYVVVNEQNVLKYELFLWYNHDTGEDDKHELPLDILGGTLTKDTECDCTFYESFMTPYFEYGDEAINVFSDWQSVRVRTAFPIREFVEQPCKDCSGHGKVQNYTKEKGQHHISCSSCDGKGYMASLGPFSDLIVDAKGGFDNNNIKGPSLRYISPPLDAQQELYKNWRELLEDANKSINLDLLESTVESGEAKKTRLQDLQDMLMKIGGNLFDVMERYLWYTECLLQPNRSQRQRPIIIQPISYELKSEEMLRVEAVEAHGADVITSLMEFNKRKYAGNDKLIRIKELALEYAPLLAITNPQDIQLRIASGAYDESDLIKRDRVEFALNRIAKDVDIINATDAEIFARIDAILAPFLPTADIPILDPNGLNEGGGS